MQKGFSLIELMIVVAIIGILAIVAIPQYQNFLARSQFSEAHTLLGASRVAVQERIDAGQTITFAQLGLQLAGSYGNIQADPSVGTDFPAGSESGDVAEADILAAGDEYTLGYSFSGANPRISGSWVYYTYTAGNGTWACTTTVPQELASNCGEA